MVPNQFNKSQMLSKYKSPLTSLFVSAVFGVVFMAYVLLIGIPRTEARNLYNKGVVAIQNSDLDTGREYFEQAIATWPEGYIVEELEILKNL